MGGVVYEADATGCVVVPAEDAAECLRHGFVPTSDAPAAAAAPSSEDEPEAAPRAPRKRRTESGA